jgi:hypothetical protein
LVSIPHQGSSLFVTEVEVGDQTGHLVEHGDRFGTAAQAGGKSRSRSQRAFLYNAFSPNKGKEGAQTDSVSLAVERDERSMRESDVMEDEDAFLSPLVSLLDPSGQRPPDPHPLSRAFASERMRPHTVEFLLLTPREIRIESKFFAEKKRTLSRGGGAVVTASGQAVLTGALGNERPDEEIAASEESKQEEKREKRPPPRPFPFRHRSALPG